MGFSCCLLRPTNRVLSITLMLLSLPLLAQEGPPLTIRGTRTNQVQVIWTLGTNFEVLEEIAGLGAGDRWREVSQAPTIVGSHYEVEPRTTNGAAFYRLASHGTPGVATPPDPIAIATPLRLNVYNDFMTSTEFLYVGSNTVQVGVAPGTINSVQAAVLRGTVRKRDGSPLPSVRVAVLNHPEFGYTFTRADGRYDLAVNASQFSLDFQAIGYCPVQRQAQVSAHDYLNVPDVVMIGADPIASVVSLGPNAPAQMAASSTQSDGAGARTARVFLPAGTSASIVMADGSTQAVDHLTIRVSEFTVGSNGMAAMPASLPPSSGYTYCAEFSGDEAVAVGARRVQFSQPVPVYVDNFVGAPVGALVPMAYYDRGQAVWMPWSNGLVIKILGSFNGSALIDLHGQGQAETAQTLASNGFTTEELQQLASLYGAGKTVWRAPVPHFSPWDFNYGLSGPNPNKPNRPGDKPTGSSRDDSPDNFGVLNFAAQTFREEVGLAGIPFRLHYNSARVPDYRVDDQITVPVKWERPAPECVVNNPNGTCALPAHYFDPPTEITVEMNVAGQHTVQTFPGTNEEATLAWDGRDAYGRLVGGSCLATITVGYNFNAWNYFGVCCGPEFQSQFPALFGNYGNLVGFEGHTDSALAVGAAFQRLLTYPDHRALGLGGWSPSPLHRLDPPGGILYYGDGRIRKVTERPIQDTLLVNPQAAGRVVACGPDGTIYYFGEVTDVLGHSENYIIRRSPGGGAELVTVSGLTPGTVGPHIGPGGWGQVDGQPASQVSLQGETLEAMSVGPDGSLYVADVYAIARLTPDGIWHVILGAEASQPPTFQPDGTPARRSFTTAYQSITMAVGPDSSVYFTGQWSPNNGTNYTMIRKIAPDGRLYTVFGAGGVAAGSISPYWRDLLGTAAYSAHYFSGPFAGLAVGQDGTLYVSPTEGQTGGGMFKISPGGVMLSFLSGSPTSGAGYGYNPNDPNMTALIRGDEGKRASEVGPGGSVPRALQVGPDGSVYFTTDSFIVWRLNPNSVLERVAGRYGDLTYSPPSRPSDNGDPLNTYVYPVAALAVAPDGSLVLARNYTSAPYELPLIVTFPGRSSPRRLLAPVGGEVIPSEDGSEIFVFDASGKHLRTLDSLTGASRWAFGYDGNSLVVTITNLAGLVTQIERDSSGRATAIVGPYGQRTTLAVDAHGFLSQVTNPALEITSLTNSSGGLLLSITGPRGDTYAVSYDTLGRVTQVADPIGGGWSVARSDLGVLSDYSYEVDVACTNSVGDTLSRVMRLLPDGDTSVDYAAGPFPIETVTQLRSGDTMSGSGDGAILATTVATDPRFGQQAEQEAQWTLSLPNGLVFKESVQRTAGVSNRFDALSLTGLTNLASINGNQYREVYNPQNRTVTMTTPEGRSITAASDTLGRLVHQAAAGLPSMDLGYDAAGRLAVITDSFSGGTGKTSLLYDGLGQLNAVVDPLGRSNTFSYDATGRVREMTLLDGSAVAIVRDSEGHVSSLSPPGRGAHTFQYNAVGLVTKYTPPFVASDESVEYQYDTERHLTRVNLADGQTVSLQHGPAGRLEQAGLGAGPTLAYEYGTNLGSGYLMPTRITSTSGDSLQLGYVGSILTNAIWSGTITGQVSVQLNSDLVPASESVNDSVVTYTYDRDGLLSQAGDLSLTRDAATGLVTGTGLGGLSDERQYDDRGLLTNYVARANGSAVWSFRLSYDLIGRITNKVESIAGVTTAYSYTYDIAGRLQEVRKNGGLSVTYSYDPNGNRMSRNAETATYDAQDRLQSYAGVSFGWSRNGNLQTRTTGGQTTTYTYDVRGALTAVARPVAARIDYVLDGAGRRVGKQLGGALQRGWLWSEDQPVAELDGSSAVSARFVYGADDQTPSFLIKGADAYRLFSDERGSVRLVIRLADGSIVQRLDYDEFGRVLADTNPGFQPFGFAGGLYDPDTGLVRFGARDYAAETGQWTARDLIEFNGGQFSLYAYVGNDPLNDRDLAGLGPKANSNPPDNGDVLGWVTSIEHLNGQPYSQLLVRPRGFNDFIKLRRGSLIRKGDVLKTDKNTVASIEFIIGGRNTINPDSSVQVVGDRNVRETDFSLKRHIWRQVDVLRHPWRDDPRDYKFYPNGGGAIKG
jgi:RHS repeat-associated protein